LVSGEFILMTKLLKTLTFAWWGRFLTGDPTSPVRSTGASSVFGGGWFGIWNAGNMRWNSTHNVEYAYKVKTRFTSSEIGSVSSLISARVANFFLGMVVVRLCKKSKFFYKKICTAPKVLVKRRNCELPFFQVWWFGYWWLKWY
jgi:hypothetical protein